MSSGDLKVVGGESGQQPAVGCTLRCPACGEEEADIVLELRDGSFFCRTCDEAITAEDAMNAAAEWERQAARWRRIVFWARQIPKE